LADANKFCDKCGAHVDAREKFCQQCGSHNLSYDYKGEPLRIEHHTDVPWLTRKRIAIFATIGVIAIFTATVAASLNTPSRTNIITGIVSEPVELVLPTRDDGIETEWRMEPVEHDYSQFILSEFTPEGFTEAVQVYFHRDDIFMEDSAVRITVYKFDSVELASSEYIKLVTMIRERGGFTERQIDIIDAACYSTSNLDSLFSTYEINSYCTISNVAFHLAGNSVNEDGIDKFAKVMAQRASNFSSN
jgi:hypothetical protein